MKLDPAQRLMLVMLADISERLDIDNGLSPSVIHGAILTENTWALDWEYSGALGFEPEATPRHVTEVVDILDMWHFLEETHARMGTEEKQQLEKLAVPYGKHVQFSGFDGNNETDHLSAAKFMINKLGRFTYFKGRDLDSHSQSVAPNLRSFAIFEQLRPELGDRSLTVDEMAKILTARVHPSNARD